jgi:hypothetical protein
MADQNEDNNSQDDEQISHDGPATSITAAALIPKRIG